VDASGGASGGVAVTGQSHREEGGHGAERERGVASDGDSSPVRTDDGGVIVPLPIYKTVTVTATLLAVIAVVGGFVLLDTATDRGRAAPAEVDAVLALAGLGAIVAAAAVYAFGTRFRAEGMRSDKADAESGSGNG
jgi:hypothetical protein